MTDCASDKAGAEFVFDDYLNLMECPLAHVKCLVFAGCTGAGKTTYATHLLRNHPDFSNQDFTHINLGRPLLWDEIDSPENKLVFVDEALVLRDLLQVANLLRRRHTLVLASHLHRGWTYFLRPFGPVLQFQLDLYWEKLRTELQRRKLTFSDAGLNQFVRRFGANFQDLDLVLEHYEGSDFDVAVARFEKFNRVDRVRNFHT